MALINITLLLLLAMIHIYWGFGGKLALKNALPTNLQDNGKVLFQPSMFATFVVAFGLLVMAYILVVDTHIFALKLPISIQNYGLKIIAAIFILRAIGDFKYVGFFKKIKVTEFGQMDSKFYSPFCFYLGVSTLYLAYN
jgi:Protein of unknown function (DUF3995)